MMNPEPLLQSWPWPGCGFVDLHREEIDPHGLNIHVGGFEFTSSLTNTEGFSDDSSFPYLGAMYEEEPPFKSISWPPPSYDGVSFAVSPFEDHISYDELFSDCIDQDVCGLREEKSGSYSTVQHESFNEGSMSSSIVKSSVTVSDEVMCQPQPPPLVLPIEEMEMDDQVGLLHLNKAHGEAIEKGFVELAEVIMKRISEKVGPLGTIMERMGHYLYQDENNKQQGHDYLQQESIKNYDPAFRAFYESCPFGRFAHHVANMVILENMPQFSETIHIIDYDTREGIQWPPMFESLVQLRRQAAVRFTSIKLKEGHESVGPQSNFEATKRRLCDYARSVGLGLEVDEMDMEELVMEKKRMMKRGGGGRNEWMIFNCMVGLPHMGMERSRRDAWEFMRTAKELITMSSTRSNNSNRGGIITFGNGDGVEIKMGGGFGSFFEGCMVHFHALFESMEWHFPSPLSLARTAMECLFLGPYISSHSCHPTWEEMHEASGPPELGFEGCRLSKRSLVEAKEMVREGESPYGVRFGEEDENELVLEWRGTPLVRVCSWK